MQRSPVTSPLPQPFSHLLIAGNEVFIQRDNSKLHWKEQTGMQE